MVDFNSDVRGYWYEWGVAEGSAGDDAAHRSAGAWLQGLSLADHLETSPITSEQAKFSCAGLGVAFGKLAEILPECPFGRARRAVAYLGRLTTSDLKALGYFNNYDRAADRISTPNPRSVEEAIIWLTTAVAQAGRELQDPFLKALLTPEQVAFNMLLDFLGSAPPPRPRPKQYTPPSAPQAQPVGDTKPVPLGSKLPELIKIGIDRVVSQAWEAVPDDAASEDRFRTARQAASQAISGLSPRIKRQVGAHFETHKWEPLKARDPKL
jgi:hypothetical protein